jgi:hypothetical protein
MKSVTKFIEGRMKLKVNKAKSGIRRPYELNFLGHSLYGKGELSLSKTSLQQQGVPEWRSWLLALSSKGWYNKSNTPQAHESMNLEWFASIDLFDMHAYYYSKLMKPPST